MSNTAYALACFMAKPTGRLLRIVLGLLVLAWGWSLRGTTAGTTLLVIGWLPILAGVLNICLIGPLIGVPLSGRKVLEPGRGAP